MSAPTPLVVTARGVRRFLLAAQDLDAGGTAARADRNRVRDEIRRLECVQIDPVSVVERNQHLVLGARLAGYTPAMLEDLLARGRVFEYVANAACVIPMEDYPLFEGTRRRMRKGARAELAPLRRAADHVLDRLEREGALPARAFDSETRIRGWWDSAHPKTKPTSHALTVLWYAGRIMVVRRQGMERYFDLPERVVPRDLLGQAAAIDPAEADQALLAKYVRAFRVLDIGDFRFGWRRIQAPQRRRIAAAMVRSGTLVPLTIEGVRRAYFVSGADADALQRHDRAARREGAVRADGPVRFLPPLDNLLWRRERIADLFGFDYTWEIYTPARKRRYGYYAMPILAGDRLIGRIDPRLDREHDRLMVNLLQLEPDVQPTRALRVGLSQSLEGFARFHGARASIVRRTRPAGLGL